MDHPLPIGTKVLSVQGEEDCTDDDICNYTGPNAVGEVRTADLYEGQGWTYGIHFPSAILAEPVWVFIDQKDSIDDPEKYHVVEPAIV